MTALAIALVAINAALVALVATLGWQMFAALKDMANERAALAQCEADLALSRANEDHARQQENEALEMFQSIQRDNRKLREAQANADTAKITSGTDVVGASADVFASMPQADDAASVSTAPTMPAAKDAGADSAKRRK